MDKMDDVETKAALSTSGATGAEIDDAKKRLREAKDGSPSAGSGGNNGSVQQPLAQEPRQKKKKQEPPKKADTTLPADAPFTADELATTLSVIGKLGKNHDLFNSAACRDLRKTMEPLVKLQIKKRGVEVGGERQPRHGAEAAILRSRYAREQQKKMHDKELLNKRRLRQERLNQLKAMAELDPRLPMIPDGAVFDGVNLSVGQTMGTSACVVSIQNTGSTPDLLEDGSAAEAASSKSTEGGDRLATIMPPDELCNPRSCYVCKCRFYKLHHFYDSLCPDCASLNWSKRMQTVDLTGKWVLLTGGRVKVGYQIALKILRAGATLVMTTRFPADAAERLSSEPDFEQWRSRIKLFGIDLRDLIAVEHLCDELNRTLPRLDVIINNACQTVRRPPAYYRHLIANERKDKFPDMIMDGSAHGLTQRSLLLVGDELSDKKPSQSLIESAAAEQSISDISKQQEQDRKQGGERKILPADLTQVPLLATDVTEDSEELFPTGAFDVNAQQVDYRNHTSWTLRLHEVSTPEAVEVFAVNSLTPMIISGRMKELMIKTRKMDLERGLPDCGLYIVNVSSMEGKFFRRKDVVHPHTNMAKASLNMMTKTSAPDYQVDHIYMTSVDTGWLSIEAPVPTAIKIAKTNFQTPIDEVDGASRVLDPVFSGMLESDPNKRLFGVFLKDYRETEW